jgi:hypothetical protein
MYFLLITALKIYRSFTDQHPRLEQFGFLRDDKCCSTQNSKSKESQLVGEKQQTTKRPTRQKNFQDGVQQFGALNAAFHCM